MIVLLGLASLQAGAQESVPRADFGSEQPSPDARHVADWVVHAGDNHSGENRAGAIPASDSSRLPFVILDKKEAKVFVFDPQGQLRGSAPVLLGLAIGDHSIPGIGERKLSSIRPNERTTPAGRFVARMGDNMRGEDVLWVDYAGAVSMHRVIDNGKDRRLQRLATPTPLDNRISFGCINIGAKFFDNVVRTTFKGTKGIVYVLPETKPAREVFSSYNVEPLAGQ